MDDNDAAVKTSLEALNSNFRDQISLLSTPDGDPKDVPTYPHGNQEMLSRLVAPHLDYKTRNQVQILKMRVA
eukprot:595069-Amphidinium_carterae.1